MWGEGGNPGGVIPGVKTSRITILVKILLELVNSLF